MATPPTFGPNTFFRELTEPSGHQVAVTPSDSVNLEAMTRGIYIGGAGNLAYYSALGDEITLTGVLAGTLLPFRVYRILSSGTTATNITAIF